MFWDAKGGRVSRRKEGLNGGKTARSQASKEKSE